MAEVLPAIQATDVHAGSARAVGKRKTPMELRMEQMKRLKQACSGSKRGDERGPSSQLHSQTRASLPGHELTHGDVTKASVRHSDAKILDIFPAAKARNAQREILPLFNKAGPGVDKGGAVATTIYLEDGHHTQNGRNVSVDMACKNKTSAVDDDDDDVGATGQDKTLQESRTFKNITDFSATHTHNNPGGVTVNMSQAIREMAFAKVVVARSPAAAEKRFAGGSKESTSPQNNVELDGTTMMEFDAEAAPLDWSLKTNARFKSPYSFDWCQLASAEEESEALRRCGDGGFEGCGRSDESGVSNKGPAGEVLVKSGRSRGTRFHLSLQSWVHPEHQLPDCLLSTMDGGSRNGGGGSTGGSRSPASEFLSKRFWAWEEAFRSLYFCLRNRTCDVFYYQGQQFVVMFCAAPESSVDEESSGCIALLTRSTKGLRSLLKDQDVEFTMPLVNAEDDAPDKQALKELHEFERAHPGRTRTIDGMAGIDNTSQSLLYVKGNKQIHRLFDFLLNYRHIAAAAAVKGDVPILYSSVPFKNSTLRMPEVVYRRMKRISGAITEGGRKGNATEDNANRGGNSSLRNGMEGGVGGITHCLELKSDVLIPPWVIQSLCSLLKEHQMGGFSGNFITEPTTTNLNVVPRRKLVDVSSRKKTGGDESPAQSSETTAMKMQGPGRERGHGSGQRQGQGQWLGACVLQSVHWKGVAGQAFRITLAPGV